MGDSNDDDERIRYSSAGVRVSYTAGEGVVGRVGDGVGFGGESGFDGHRGHEWDQGKEGRRE
jgi:hypothetical protein